MNDTVVDSSVVAKWIIAEPDSPQAQRVLSESAFQGKRLFVLDLVLVEVTNAIWKLHHRGLATQDQAHEFLDKLSTVSVNIHAAGSLLKSALELAIKYDCAVYDALFVALCQSLALPGVTADEPLYQAIHKDYPQITLLRNWAA